MTLRLDPDTALAVVRGHEAAVGSITGAGGPPAVDAGEAAHLVSQMLEDLRWAGDRFTSINAVLAREVAGAVTGIELVDGGVAQALDGAKVWLP